MHGIAFVDEVEAKNVVLVSAVGHDLNLAGALSSNDMLVLAWAGSLDCYNL